MTQERKKEEKQITDMLCAAEVELEALPFTVKGRRTKESAEVIRTYSRAGEKQIDPAISGYPKRWKYRS